MMPSLTHSVLSFRARAISFSASDLADRPYKIHDDHGLSAIEEEEAALEHAEELAVLKAGFRSSDISSGDDAACRTGSRSDTSQHLGETFHCDSEQDDGPEAVDLGLDEDENDHCLSGVCLPPSQFFQTSVICSNTMTRDGLETLAENTQENRDHEHKDHLSRGIGYVCFLSAFFASIYSLLKYLRNIRRISTRYPFAQAGAWTFTVGMFLGMLIMVALVLANTSHI
ncbi:hypothetical protein EDD11_001822 [Mortierella claussenii]|nr:hypothetical protein EDD11_001822 [Mortierella claussenii]